MTTAPNTEQAWRTLVRQLTAARTQHALSQRDLSRQLDMATITVGRWETLADYPALASLVHWAAALDLSPTVVAGANRREIKITMAPRSLEPLEHFTARRIGTQLHRARRQHKWTQQHLGNQLQVTAWTVRMWETAHREPRIPHLLAWADTLHCTLALRSGTP